MKAGDRDGAPRLVIPSQLEGFAELKAALMAWRRTKPVSSTGVLG